MTTKYIETNLAPHLTLRSVQWSDLNAVTQLIYEVCAADGDTVVAVTADELKHEWQTPGFDLDQDAFLVETGDARIVGYVHPDFKGRGVGTALMRIIEQRARDEMTLAEPEVRASLRSTIDNRDPVSHELHKNEGYQPLRYHWRMEIVLESPPPEPTFPAEIELRPFIKGEHDVAVWQAQNEAFRDHWGSHDATLEEWKQSRFDDPEFDSTLWPIAWDRLSVEVAGFSLNRYRMGIGWIRTLGVRRRWRKRGLGEALLLHSFGEFYKRGTKTIGLGVDAQNPTGATRLYQKVGMVAVSEFVTYEKELRPGRA